MDIPDTQVQGGDGGVCVFALANTENYYNGLQCPFDSLQNKIKWDFFE